MPELSIRFTTDEQAEGTPIQVLLSRPESGASTQPAPFVAPLGDPELADLRWYLEVFASWPTGPDYERAKTIESHLQSWGQALLDSVLNTDEAIRLWEQFINDEGTRLLTIDATDPRVLQLPWELLADSTGHLFSRQVSIRRRLRQTTPPATTRTFELPVRVLVVVSRPKGSGFIPPRAVSKPLLDALDRLGNRVETEFLYPPTLAAISARLYDETAPPVHVVHFDGHGVYDQTQSLGYLLFEDDNHQADLVNAKRLGNLLTQCGVPLMVLNACQSARQDVQESDNEDNPFASVAARLIRSGVSSVLAMNYSVLVVAAQKFVEAFYGGLASGMTVGRAVDRARMALLADPARHTLPRRSENGQIVDETIQLRDWFLPALYQQAADPVVFPQESEGTATLPRAIPRALADPSVPGGLPGEPRHGFHGRAREMLRLERELADRAIVVLHGMGGMGKTSLAAEVGRWFYRTGRFPGGTAFVSFEYGGSLDQLCSWVGQAVSGDPNFSLEDGDPVQRVADLLAEKPALVILDNFESVLGADPLMPFDELKAVLDAVWLWAQTGARSGASRTGTLGSRVLITTRSVQFNDARFEQGKHCAHVPLGGLERDDALELAGSILDNLEIDRDRVDRAGLVALMDYLDGHPLSLNLVLPHLKEHTPARLIERFEEMLPGFTSGAARERHESLEVSLEFSLRRLGDETRAELPSLAVFRGGCLEDNLLEVTGMDPTMWQTVRTELEAAGLVSVQPVPGINPPFLQFHPTLLPYLAGLLPPDRRGPLEDRYWRRYYSLANFLYSTDSQHPFQARAVAIRELPNMRHAFELALEAVRAGEAEAVIVVDFDDSIARFLLAFGRRHEREALLAQLKDLDIASDEGMTKAEFLMYTQQGDLLLQQGRAHEAEHAFRELLARMDAGTAPSYQGNEADYDRALTLMRIGRCLEVIGQPIRAIEQHREAQKVFERLSPTSRTAKQMLGAVHTDVADLYAALGRFDEAEASYKAALAIDEELGDLRGKGVDLGQLGSLALRRGDLEEARRRYNEALDTFRRMGEPQSEAVVWHQLGMLEQREEHWEESERCYRESLRLKEQQGDRPGVAHTCHQLGLLFKEAGRPLESEKWYLRAQKIKDEIAPYDDSTLHNLAILYLSLERLDEARHYAERATAIVTELDISAEPWKNYIMLARITKAQGDEAAASEWQRKAWASRDQFPGSRHHLAPIFQQFVPVIEAIVAAAHGDPEARTRIEGFFDTLKEKGWDIVDAIQRIWNGERDPDALTDGLDYNSRAVVLGVLHRLGVPVSPLIAELVSGTGTGPSGPGPGAGPGPTPGGPPPTGDGQEEEEGFSLEQLFGMVKMAISPGAPPGLPDMLKGLMNQMMTDPDAPAEARQLARALLAILNGDRQPDLSGMPPQLTQMIQQILN